MNNGKISCTFIDEQKDLLEGKVADNIRKNRMGKMKIKVVDGDNKAVKGAIIKVNQTRHDFRYGANIFMLDQLETEEKNEAYKKYFADTFNLATVPFYWKDLEPEQDKPRYEKNTPVVYRRPSPDLCLEFCNEHDIEAKLHCLFYGAHLPDWLPKNDEKEMIRLYRKRLQEISSRYADKMNEFEVINETLLERDWNKQSILSTRRDIIDFAFALSKEYFPNNKLVINDASYTPDLAREDYRNAYFLLLEGLLQRNCPIDTIGMQHHYFAGANLEKQTEEVVRRDSDNYMNPEKTLKALDILAELKKPLEVTEVTIPTFGEDEESEIAQAKLIEAMYSVWFSHEKVDTVVYWNTVDHYAYNDGNRAWNENLCLGGLLHKDLTPKLGGIALQNLFKKKWHTELENATNSDGSLDFDGYFGKYEVDVNGKKFELGLHKNDKNEYTLKI